MSNINSLLLVVTCRQSSSQSNVTGYKRQMRQDDATDVLLLGDLAPPLTGNAN